MTFSCPCDFWLATGGYDGSGRSDLTTVLELRLGSAGSSWCCNLPPFSGFGVLHFENETPLPINVVFLHLLFHFAPNFQEPNIQSTLEAATPTIYGTESSLNGESIWDSAGCMGSQGWAPDHRRIPDDFLSGSEKALAVDVLVQCMEHYKALKEAVKQELKELKTQDFFC